MAQSFNPTASEKTAQWSEQAQDMGRRASEQAQELGRRAADSTTTAAATARDFVEEHPAATAAVIGGFAFAVGALWMLGRSR